MDIWKEERGSPPPAPTVYTNAENVIKHGGLGFGLLLGPVLQMGVVDSA